MICPHIFLIYDGNIMRYKWGKNRAILLVDISMIFPHRP